MDFLFHSEEETCFRQFNVHKIIAGIRKRSFWKEVPQDSKIETGLYPGTTCFMNRVFPYLLMLQNHFCFEKYG